MVLLCKGTHANNMHVRIAKYKIKYPRAKSEHTVAWADAAFEKKEKYLDLKDLCLHCLRDLMQLLDIGRQNSWEAKGTYAAFLQHMALLKPLLEDCFLLNYQHCRKDIRKVKEVFKTDTRIIWGLDNLLTSSIPFYLYAKRQQDAVARS